MKAQEYLEQVEKLNVMIENKMAEVAQWRDVAIGITAYSDCDRVQSSGSQQKMADAINRVIDLQAEINSMIDGLISVKQEIIRTIEQLNATEYDVLHKRYIQNMSFDEIGASKGKSKSWATTIHGRALQSVKRLLDEQEKRETERMCEIIRENLNSNENL